MSRRMFSKFRMWRQLLVFCPLLPLSPSDPCALPASGGGALSPLGWLPSQLVALWGAASHLGTQTRSPTCSGALGPAYVEWIQAVWHVTTVPGTCILTRCVWSCALHRSASWSGQDSPPAHPAGVPVSSKSEGRRRTWAECLSTQPGGVAGGWAGAADGQSARAQSGERTAWWVADSGGLRVGGLSGAIPPCIQAEFGNLGPFQKLL